MLFVMYVWDWNLPIAFIFNEQVSIVLCSKRCYGLDHYSIFKADVQWTIVLFERTILAMKFFNVAEPDD